MCGKNRRDNNARRRRWCAICNEVRRACSNSWRDIRRRQNPARPIVQQCAAPWWRDARRHVIGDCHSSTEATTEPRRHTTCLLRARRRYYSAPGRRAGHCCENVCSCSSCYLQPLFLCMLPMAVAHLSFSGGVAIRYALPVSGNDVIRMF